jgi:phage terminase large subunit
MLFSTGPLYDENLKQALTNDIIVNQGGTSSGKTYNILDVLFTKAIDEPNSIITVAGQDIPNLKKGALRDAENIVRSSPYLQQAIADYHKTDRVFTLHNGSLIEFNSYSNFQDAKSGKRHYLFINEANGIPYNVYTELYLRTNPNPATGLGGKTFIDYNPNAEFWVHRELIGKPGVAQIISDHRHNPFVDQRLRDKIENLINIDYELWKVYARGLTGRLEGVIFRRFNVVMEIPAEARFIGYGMDFGYSNDPTALVEVFIHNGELWVNELIYEGGLLNKHIIEELKALGIHRSREIIADSAEPKSIAEIGEAGYNIQSALKGPDSVRNSINLLLPYVINVTQRSTNLRKEFSTYKWKQTKDGILLNEPVDFNNHAIDALRYVALNKFARLGKKGKYSII